MRYCLKELLSLWHQRQFHVKRSKECNNDWQGYNESSYFDFANRRISSEFSSLTIHCKNIFFGIVRTVQQPDREKHIFAFIKIKLAVKAVFHNRLTGKCIWCTSTYKFFTDTVDNTVSGSNGNSLFVGVISFCKKRSLNICILFNFKSGVNISWFTP